MFEIERMRFGIEGSIKLGLKPVCCRVDWHTTSVQIHIILIRVCTLDSNLLVSLCSITVVMYVAKQALRNLNFTVNCVKLLIKI